MVFLFSFIITSEAFDLWITTPAIGAEANRSMLLGTTDGIVTARIADDARILTNLLFASFVQWALRIGSTFDVHLGNCFKFIDYFPLLNAFDQTIHDSFIHQERKENNSKLPNVRNQ